MDKTFRKNIIAYFMGAAKKHKLLKYPCLAAMSVSLLFYYAGRHFTTNGKRYASMVFVAAFFMSSCSFSFAVFAERTGFAGVQETYSAIVETSDVSLAVVEPVTPPEKVLLDETGIVTEHEDAEIEAYTLDDLLENHGQMETHDHEETARQADTEPITDTETLAFDSSDWRLTLINKQHPIPDEYDFKLGTFTSGMRCDERVIEDLLLMMQAAKRDGLNLVVRSPYRTSDHQEDNFNGRIKSYMKQGLSYMEAYKIASQIVTVPGASEHQVGLALDIWSDTYKTLDKGFEDTEAGKWLAQHSSEYGFILRYPKGKEDITKVSYESWHFRYVGVDAAKEIMSQGITLEEYLQFQEDR